MFATYNQGQDMYERFTDRARLVMKIASEEARKFGHGYLGTQHILLALLVEGNGVGGRVIKNHVDEHLIRQLVEMSIRPAVEIPTIPPAVLPNSPRVQRVLAESVNVAKELNHGYVGTEHLLLAFFKVPDCVALQFLQMHEITEEEIKNLLAPESLLSESELRLVAATAVYTNAINSNPKIKTAVIELLKNSSYDNVEITMFALVQTLKEAEPEKIEAHDATETPK